MKRFRVVLLTAFVFLLYLLTLSSDIYLEDSAEFVTASHFLGIAHPSGYPLYLLIAKLFSFIPIGELAFRVNLLSAVFGALTVVTLYLVLEETAKYLGRHSQVNSWLAFFVALILGVSRDFWSQSIVAEVYTLNSFLVALTVLVLLKWLRKKDTKKLYWLAFLSGLGLANHLLFGFILPVVWVIVFVSSAQKIKDVSRFVPLFILGLSVYLYLPVRSAANPGFEFSQITGFIGSLNHALRLGYQDLGFAVFSSFKFLISFFESLSLNLYLFVIIAAIGGLVAIYRAKNEQLLILGFFGFIFSGVLPIFLRNVAFSHVAEFIYRVYYFQAYIFVLLLAFIFAVYTPKRWKIWLTGVLLILVSLTAIQNYGLVDLSGNEVAAYYEEKLMSFGANSVYLLVGEGYAYESELFAFLYLQKVKGLRADVTLVDASQIAYQPNRELTLSDSDDLTLDEIRIVYLNYVFDEYRDREIYVSFPASAYGSYVSPQAELRNGIYLDKLGRSKWDLAYQDFLAAVYYQKAFELQSRGQPEEAGEYFVKAINFDNQIDSEDARAFRIFRSELTK